MSVKLKSVIAFVACTLIWVIVFQMLPEGKKTPTTQQIFLAGTMAQHDHWVNGKKNPLMYSEAEIDSLALAVRVK